MLSMRLCIPPAHLPSTDANGSRNCMYTNTQTHEPIETQPAKQIKTQGEMCTRQTNRFSNIHVWSNGRCRCVRTRQRMCVHVHAQAHTSTQTRTHTHTRTHTYLHTCCVSSRGGAGGGASPARLRRTTDFCPICPPKFSKVCTEPLPSASALPDTRIAIGICSTSHSLLASASGAAKCVACDAIAAGLAVCGRIPAPATVLWYVARCCGASCRAVFGRSRSLAK